MARTCTPPETLMGDSEEKENFIAYLKRYIASTASRGRQLCSCASFATRNHLLVANSVVSNQAPNSWGQVQLQQSYGQQRASVGQAKACFTWHCERLASKAYSSSCGWPFGTALEGDSAIGERMRLEFVGSSAKSKWSRSELWCPSP